ncbi:MAG: hypothetical protein JW891_09475 [Candidatus Lokiarchaeota archaeon]|nr:hypothetical protein [Candidatus Lokiarchaeota archaeon]
MGKNNIAIVVLGILAVTGLVLSGYIFISNVILSPEEPKSESDLDSGYILVGLWDYLYDYGDDQDFLIEFLSYQEFLNSYYITKSSNSTGFFLTKIGIYKLTLNVALNDIDPDCYYLSEVLVNGSSDEIFEVYQSPSGGGQDEYQISSTLYVNNSIVSYYEIRLHSYTDDFGIALDQDYNQFAIEFQL